MTEKQIKLFEQKVRKIVKEELITENVVFENILTTELTNAKKSLTTSKISLTKTFRKLDNSSEIETLVEIRTLIKKISNLIETIEDIEDKITELR